MYTEIRGDKFGILFAGCAPEGKALDIAATERGMQIDLDAVTHGWSELNPEPDRESSEWPAWEETQRAALDSIGEQFLQDTDWYDSNLIWIDA